ncbi:MAG: glutathione S-transferase [Pseudomonadales bacterium]|nr:glutathione S-transferase [Pseudomonadales bacterium]
MTSNRSTDPNQPLILWGTSHSLYTGKVRSYLIKKGLGFTELMPHHPRFQAEIVARIRHFVVPVLETADGALYQDSTVIIDELERCFPDRPMVPTTPVLRVLAHLLDAFGTQALLPAAMHYRWSYRAEQEHFLQAEFGRAVHHGPDREARLAAGAALMDYFNDFLPGLGISPGTAAVFETAYEELLDALDVHFQHWPYLLGGHPSIADFGFMAPLYAHLARDPVPSTLMKNRAANVYRWTERMNLGCIDDGEFPDLAENWFPDDSIASTLEPVLRLLFADWGPQLIAEAQFTNAWMAANKELPSGHVASRDGKRSVHATLGTVRYPWRGVTVERSCMPTGLWHFEHAACAARELQGPARERLAALMQRVGGTEAMQIRLVRALVHRDFVLTLD